MAQGSRVGQQPYGLHFLCNTYLSCSVTLPYIKDEKGKTLSCHIKSLDWELLTFPKFIYPRCVLHRAALNEKIFRVTRPIIQRIRKTVEKTNNFFVGDSEYSERHIFISFFSLLDLYLFRAGNTDWV